MTVLITGASSGIGAALARAYAAPGNTLFLGGRNAGRLDAVADACAAAGAGAYPFCVEATDAAACARWIESSDDSSPLDLVIANAGISAGTGGGKVFEEESGAMRRILEVNIGGTLNTVIPAIARMRARKRGQIGIVSSLASFIGTPGAGAYCASKAAQRVLGEALRAELAADGIGISVICPGFIKTPMTAGNPFPMPFLMGADKAAAIIRRGLSRNRPRIAFPWPMYWLVRFAAALPPAITDWGIRRFPQKG